MPRLAFALASLGGVAALAAPPEAALLLTPAGGDTTQLVFARPGEAGLSPAVAAFRHVKGAEVKGATIPGTRRVVAIAQRLPARDESWASALWLLEPGLPARQLADRVYHATRPLVTKDGRVFVQRGTPGPDPTEDEWRAGRLRTDALTIDEVDLATGGTRVVHRTQGYIAFLAGSLLGELFVYRVRFGHADLVAVNADSGEVRPLLASMAPFARDFAVDEAAGAILFTTLDAASRTWVVERLDVRTGASSRLAFGPRPSLLPHPWPGGTWAFNPAPGGLRVVGRERPKGPFGSGFDVVRAFSRDGHWALLSHEDEGELPLPYVLGTSSGEVLRFAVPLPSRVDVAGFVEVRR